MDRKSVYEQIMVKVFLDRLDTGSEAVDFTRDDLETAARELGLGRPKNLGDILYSYRYRRSLPDEIAGLAPAGREWVIRATGNDTYRFEVIAPLDLSPNPSILPVKIPDSTPGLITTYALDDEQALLAILRYNRIIDIMLGVSCYSLQSHLRTKVGGIQSETDEIYVGVDKDGAHYVIPVQAKGGRDRIGLVQIEQDIAMCRAKFARAICRPVTAQFLGQKTIALFELAQTSTGIGIRAERHFRLVEPEAVADSDLDLYRNLVNHSTGGG